MKKEQLIIQKNPIREDWPLYLASVRGTTLYGVYDAKKGELVVPIEKTRIEVDNESIVMFKESPSIDPYGNVDDSKRDVIISGLWYTPDYGAVEMRYGSTVRERGV